MAETVTGRRERKEKLEDILVVDCDVHVHESPGSLIPYCEMPWRVALENIKDVQEFYLDIPGFSPGTTAYEAKFPSGQEGTRMVHTAEQMREELDAIHVDIGVLFPDHFLKIPVISQIDYAAALARAYNAWLLDRVVLAGVGSARVHPGLPPGPRGRGARDPQVRQRTRHGRGLPALRRAGAALGAQAVRPYLRGRPGGRPARSSCTA